MRGVALSISAALVLSVARLALGDTPPSETCPPGPDRGEIAKLRQMSCDVPQSELHEFSCENCPTTSELMRRVKQARGTKRTQAEHQRGMSSNSYDKCHDRMTAYFCRVSPWRDLTLKERYERIRDIVAALETPAVIYKEALPCIAAAETLFLEPLTLSCQTSTVKAVGLAQLDQSTFVGLFESKEIGDYAWMAPYSCMGSPYYQPDLKVIFDKIYPRDPVMQLGTMSLDLAEKARGFRGRATRDKTLEVVRLSHDNSNDPDRRLKAYRYAAQVMSCVDCLRTERGRADPIHCIDKASPEDLSHVTGKVCDLPRFR